MDSIDKSKGKLDEEKVYYQMLQEAGNEGNAAAWLALDMKYS